tara:strand:- start:152 stop:328 length:177 start_codon:yes stop_codon:yes gene_type:complete
MPHTFPITPLGTYTHQWGQTTYNSVPTQSMTYTTYSSYNMALQGQTGDKLQHTNRFRQ